MGCPSLPALPSCGKQHNLRGGDLQHNLRVGNLLSVGHRRSLQGSEYGQALRNAGQGAVVRECTDEDKTLIQKAGDLACRCVWRVRPLCSVMGLPSSERALHEATSDAKLALAVLSGEEKLRQISQVQGRAKVQVKAKVNVNVNVKVKVPRHNVIDGT